MSLLSDEKLCTKFDQTFDFYTANEHDHKKLFNFLYYLHKRLNLCHPSRSSIESHVHQCMDLISQKKSDYVIYKYLRDKQKQHRKGDVSDASLRQFENTSYQRTITQKVDELQNAINMFQLFQQPAQQSDDDTTTTTTTTNDKNDNDKNDNDKNDNDKNDNNTMMINNNNNNKYTIPSTLDIGTERLEFLDALKERFSVQTVRGINIDVGFCHYDERFVENVKDERFQLYDGKTIPFSDDSFDLITLFSVIHHIPSDEFKLVCQEIARVCRGYLYLKDVDLVDQVAEIMFRIQHYVFEGVFLPGDCSYMNCEVTKEATLEALKDAGFKVVHVKNSSNFNNTYFALLQSPTNHDVLPAAPVAIVPSSSTSSHVRSSHRGGRGKFHYNNNRYNNDNRDDNRYDNRNDNRWNDDGGGDGDDDTRHFHVVVNKKSRGYNSRYNSSYSHQRDDRDRNYDGPRRHDSGRYRSSGDHQDRDNRRRRRRSQSPPPSSSSHRSQPSQQPVDEEEMAKRARRAERFGAPTTPQTSNNNN